jgi:hypothetical protein
MLAETTILNGGLRARRIEALLEIKNMCPKFIVPDLQKLRAVAATVCVDTSTPDELTTSLGLFDSLIAQMDKTQFLTFAHALVSFKTCSNSTLLEFSPSYKLPIWNLFQLLAQIFSQLLKLFFSGICEIM